MKKFYSDVAVAEDDAGLRITLDGRDVRTPAKHVLQMPHRPLADAIAAEWSAQEDDIVPTTMPLTRLANTAIDRVADARDIVIEEVMRFAETDLVCHRVSHPPELASRQAAAWDPLVDWLDETIGARLEVTDGIFALEQPVAALVALRAHIADPASYDAFRLTGLHTATASAGSIVIGLAVANDVLSAEDAFDQSLIEENFQIENWGEDSEATKRRESLKADIDAASRFLKACGAQSQ